MKIDMLNNQFSVSSYSKSSSDVINENTSNNIVVLEETDSLEDLEKQWIKYLSLNSNDRHLSDWNSITILGVDINTRYEDIRDKILGVDQSAINESFEDIMPMNYPEMDISDSITNIDTAIKWGEENNRIIIYPTKTLEELEDLWDSFNGMTSKHRRESNWASDQIFGMSNLRHYELLKLKFLNNDIYEIDKQRYGSIIENSIFPYHRKFSNYLLKECGKSSNLNITKSLLESVSRKNNIQEEMISDTLISDILDKSEAIETFPTMIIPYGDMPMLDPDQMIDYGVYSSNPEDNFYGVYADNLEINDGISTKEWFENYRGYMEGIHTGFTSMSSKWLQKIKELSLSLFKLDGDDIKARKQSILELGWNPNIYPDSNNLKLAREFAKNTIMEKNRYTRIVDLQEFMNDDFLKMTLSEDTNASNLKPIFIVLSEGKSISSKINMAFTNTIYSHASIAFDPYLSSSYSFKMGTDNGWKGGFSEEHLLIERKPDSNLGVFVMFVSEDLQKQIKDRVGEYVKKNIKTLYSYGNIVTLVFNIPWDRTNEEKKRMICSQFVDKCLKYIGVVISDKDSLLVNPGDLRRYAKKNRKVYTLYEGPISKYNPAKIDNMLNKLILRAKPIKEVSSFYYSDERSFIRGIISNLNDPLSLMEMENHIDIVKNPNIRNILEHNIFSVLRIEPYAEFGNNESLSLFSVKNMIDDYVKPY